VVIYPYMTIPLLVGRIPSVNAIEARCRRNRVLFVLAQRRPDVPDPVSKDLYRVGTVVRVSSSSGSPTARCGCWWRGSAARAPRSSSRLGLHGRLGLDHRGQGAAGRTARGPDAERAGSFNDYVHLNRRVPDEVLSTANNIGNPVLLSYTVASHLILKVAVKQAVLEEDTSPRLPPAQQDARERPRS